MFDNDWSKVGVIILGYIVGLYFQRRDIDSLKESTKTRFEDLYRYLEVRFKSIEDDIKEIKEDLKELRKISR